MIEKKYRLISILMHISSTDRKGDCYSCLFVAQTNQELHDYFDPARNAGDLAGWPVCEYKSIKSLS